jgi:hypothetical protein
LLQSVLLARLLVLERIGIHLLLIADPFGAQEESLRAMQ